MTDDDIALGSVRSDTIDAKHDELDQLTGLIPSGGRIQSETIVIETASGERLQFTAEDGNVVIERE